MVRKLLAAMALTAFALVGAGAGPALASVQTTHNPTVDIVSDRTGGGLGPRIGGAISQLAEDNQAQLVKDSIDKAFHLAGQHYNVIMMNLAQHYQEQLNNKVLYANIRWEGIYYGLWVFDDGHFENQGKGGYENWGMVGWFTKNNGVVDFNKP
ncbi:hypothetical protein [Kutzneria sp. NPDC051319]|uniref:hypothetical protein n=1 Tax=Kutzneria sp. NPDC051319 TaxID=3155047 RepID=UPI0034204CC3